MDYNAPPNSWTFGKAQQEFELSSGLSNYDEFDIQFKDRCNRKKPESVKHRRK